LFAISSSPSRRGRRVAAEEGPCGLRGSVAKILVSASASRILAFTWPFCLSRGADGALDNHGVGDLVDQSSGKEGRPGLPVLPRRARGGGQRGRWRKNTFLLRRRPAWMVSEGEGGRNSAETEAPRRSWLDIALAGLGGRSFGGGFGTEVFPTSGPIGLAQIAAGRC